MLTMPFAELLDAMRRGETPIATIATAISLAALVQHGLLPVA